jgi:N,N'-diacetyllegionaminate synthase
MDDVYLIAEIGINHEGDIRKCAKMIEEASLAGANAVKLQTINPDKSYLKTSPSYQIFKDSQLTKDDTAKIFKYARSLNIDIFTTVANEETAKWVSKLNPCAWKISSGLLNHTPLINHLCKYTQPIYISTGMALLEDIDNAIDIIKDNKKVCTLFQCTSEYPLRDKNVNLGAINFFKEKYGVEVGYSDHSIGNYICSMAVASGAKKIEKHFTFDKSRLGYDHSISADAKDFKKLVEEIKKIKLIFGKNEKKKSQAIINARQKNLRYLVSAKQLKRDSILSSTDFEIKRIKPGEIGIQPNQIKKLIGRKLKNSIFKNQVFKIGDFYSLNEKN